MQNYTKTFYKTLVFNVATISAIVVGVFQFAVRAFVENNGKEKVQQFTLQVLRFLDNSLERFQSKLEKPEVQVVKVSQNSRKKKVSAT